MNGQVCLGPDAGSDTHGSFDPQGLGMHNGRDSGAGKTGGAGVAECPEARPRGGCREQESPKALVIGVPESRAELLWEDWLI